jgi:hypothetical protein
MTVTKRDLYAGLLNLVAVVGIVWLARLSDTVV